MKYLYLLFALVFGPNYLFAQKLIPHALVLKIKPQYAAQARAASLPHALFAAGTLHTCIQMFADAGPVDKPKSDLPQTDLRTIYECRLKPHVSPEKLAFQLQKHPYIEYAEPMRTCEPLYVPNDPHANPSTGGQASVLRRIRAYQAWDISKGDSLMSIGILDTGLRWAFEDFAKNVRTNPQDPINGIDDDQNGLIDDFRGWDFSDNDNNPDFTNNAHGCAVAGLAAAVPDNAKGLAGPGFYTKILPVRIFGNRFAGYQGIVYAAQKGCKVINLSWGAPGLPSGFEQDVIRYAAINQDALIVAAGGNTNLELEFYPASYDFVVAVAHTDTLDRKNINATFNTKIDICAPGTAMFGTDGIVYGPIGDGSSYAAPIVSGAAALVRARFPNLNALQAAEILRINADDISSVPSNAPFLGKLGRGRLNMEKSLLPFYAHAIRLNAFVFDAGRGLSTPLPLDTVRTSFRLTNFLAPVSNAQITLMPNPDITILQSGWQSGALGSQASLISDTTIIFVCNANPASRRILLSFKIEYQNIVDFHYEYVNLNTNTITLQTPKAAFTLAANGRLGFATDRPQDWGGLVFQNKSQLYEGGLMVATGPTRVADCVRGTGNVPPNNHFKPLLPLRFLRPVVGGAGARQYGFGIMSDSLAGGMAPGVITRLRAHGHQNGAAANTFLLEYELQNNTNQTLDSVCAGIFADFDLEVSDFNFANYDTVSKIGYCYGYGLVDTVFAGIVAINPAKNYRTFCVLDTFGQNLPQNIKVSDGLSQAEKFRALNMGLSRSRSHPNAVNGTELAVVAGQKVFNLLPNQRKKMVFGIILSKSLEELRTNYAAMIEQARPHIAGPAPILPTQKVCKDAPLLLTPTGAGRFGFYQTNSLVVSSLLHTGSNYLIASVDTGKHIWISNADSLLEGNPAGFHIRTNKPLTALNASVQNPIWPQDSVVIYSATTRAAAQIRWQVLGSHTSSNKSLNPLRIKFTGPGAYTVKIWTQDSTGCTDSLSITLSVPLSNKTTINQDSRLFEIFPNPAQPQKQTYIQTYASGTVSCYNATGQLVFSGILPANSSALPVPSVLQKLERGSYWLRFESNQNKKQIIFWQNNSGF